MNLVAKIRQWLARPAVPDVPQARHQDIDAIATRLEGMEQGFANLEHDVKRNIGILMKELTTLEEHCFGRRNPGGSPPSPPPPGPPDPDDFGSFAN